MKDIPTASAGFNAAGRPVLRLNVPATWRTARNMHFKSPAESGMHPAVTTSSPERSSGYEPDDEDQDRDTVSPASATQESVGSPIPAALPLIFSPQSPIEYDDDDDHSDDEEDENPDDDEPYDSGYCSGHSTLAIGVKNLSLGLKHTEPCGVCYAPSNQTCLRCGGISYCSLEHAELDDPLHNLLCQDFASMKRKWPGYKTVIVFPAISDEPYLRMKIDLDRYKNPRTYWDIKGVVTAPGQYIPSKQNYRLMRIRPFPLDHVIRIVPVEIGGNSVQVSPRTVQNNSGGNQPRFNRSLWNCMVNGSLTPSVPLKGAWMAISYKRDADGIHWLDCTPADVRYIVTFLWREQHRVYAHLHQSYSRPVEQAAYASNEEVPHPAKRIKLSGGLLQRTPRSAEQTAYASSDEVPYTAKRIELSGGLLQSTDGGFLQSTDNDKQMSPCAMSTCAHCLQSTDGCWIDKQMSSCAMSPCAHCCGTLKPEEVQVLMM